MLWMWILNILNMNYVFIESLQNYSITGRFVTGDYQQLHFQIIDLC